MLRSLFPILLVALAVSALAQISPPRMPRTPDIHGDKIVFSAEGDLWLGSLSGGVASRITTHEGTEINPKFSPDGKSVAFTGQYDGGTDVYVMPTEGGAPKRLTFDPVSAEMVCWAPDGKSIVFRSRRSGPFREPRFYTVSSQGGLPLPMPMQKGAQASFSADGKKLAYTRLAL